MRFHLFHNRVTVQPAHASHTAKAGVGRNFDSDTRLVGPFAGFPFPLFGWGLTISPDSGFGPMSI